MKNLAVRQARNIFFRLKTKKRKKKKNREKLNREAKRLMIERLSNYIHYWEERHHREGK